MGKNIYDELKDLRKTDQDLLIKIKNDYSNQFDYTFNLIYLYYLVAFIAFLTSFDKISQLPITPFGFYFSIAFFLPLFIFIINAYTRKRNFDELKDFLKNRKKS